MNNIDMDVASELEANRTVKATKFLSKENNALNANVPWEGKVYCNPPFGVTEVQGKKVSVQGCFMQKMVQEFKAGRVIEAVCVIKGALGYKWFSLLLKEAPLCLLYGKVNFRLPRHLRGVPVRANPHGSVLVYYGPNVQRFKDVFGDLGKFVNC